MMNDDVPDRKKIAVDKGTLPDLIKMRPDEVSAISLTRPNPTHYIRMGSGRVFYKGRISKKDQLKAGRKDQDENPPPKMILSDSGIQPFPHKAP